MDMRRSTSCVLAAICVVAGCVVAGCVVAGCAIRPESRLDVGPDGLLETPVGPVLARLWNAHGGLESWREFATATVVVHATGSAEMTAPPARLSFPLREWSEPDVELAPAGGVLDLERGGVPLGDLQAHQYQVQTARALFHLPFSFAAPGWELRRSLLARRQQGESHEGFWAIPSALPSPHVGYYVVPDPRTDLLRTVYYEVQHPYLGGLLFAAEFRNYRWVQGVRFATEIKHRLVANLNRREEFVAGAVDPFDSRQRSLLSAPLVAGAAAIHPWSHGFDWTLRFEDITLVVTDPDRPEQTPESAPDDVPNGVAAPRRFEEGSSKLPPPSR